MVVIDSEITDPDGLANISGRLAEAVESHGGRFLIRGGAIEVQGGDLAPARMAVAEFESIEQVRGLFALKAFTELREMRSKFAKANAFIVEGAM